jgi:FixJ family two-component response regulator
MPVVMVTGFADIMRDIGDQPPAIDGIIRKPFTVETLREGIAKALAGREAATVGTDPPAKGVLDLLVETLHQPMST